MTPRVIAFASDFHFFSRYALFPPEGFTTAEGLTILPGEGQLKLWDYYIQYVEATEKEEVDTVVLVGDTLHGQNPIERGTMLVSPNMDEQVELAVRALKPLVDNRKLFMVSGSGYHTSTKGHNPEKDICDRLGGEWWGPIANVKFGESEKIFNISHGESAAYIYREMLMGRESMFQQWAASLGKIPRINVIIRGHWHNFIYIHAHGQHMLQLPAWMAYEPSKPYLKSYGKMQPDIGGSIVRIDNQDRLRVWHYLYEAPHIADFVRTV